VSPLSLEAATHKPAVSLTLTYLYLFVTIKPIMSFTSETITQLRELARRSQSTAFLDAFKVAKSLATDVLQSQVFNVMLGYEISPEFNYTSLQSSSSWSLEMGAMRAGCPVNVRRRRNVRDPTSWDYYIVFQCEGWQLGVNETDIMRSLEYAIEDWMSLSMALVHYYHYTHDDLHRWVVSDEHQLLLEYQSVALLQRGISKKQMIHSPRVHAPTTQYATTTALVTQAKHATAAAVTTGGNEHQHQQQQQQLTSVDDDRSVVQQRLMDDTREFRMALYKALEDAGLTLPSSAEVWVEKQYDPSQHVKPYKYYLFKESDDDHTRRYYTRPKAIAGILKNIASMVSRQQQEEEEEEEEEEGNERARSETLSQKRRRVHEEDDDETEEDSEVVAC
jgi:hypothetical protein